jgi:hypothetical protein
VRFTRVKGTDRRSTSSFNKATRLTAGSRNSPMRLEPAFYLTIETINFKLLIILSYTGPVEMTGFEPVAFALQRRCSPAELHPRALSDVRWA